MSYVRTFQGISTLLVYPSSLVIYIDNTPLLLDSFKYHIHMDEYNDITYSGKRMRKSDRCRVVTYNILADGYATSGGHDSYCSTTHLSWEYRSKRILCELKMYDADILGLQEVEERFAVGELKTFFEKTLGYQV